MSGNYWPLIELFAEMPDFRCARGKRHPLPAILSLACCAMLCGYRSYSAIAEWGQNYGVRLAQALGVLALRDEALDVGVPEREATTEADGEGESDGGQLIVLRPGGPAGDPAGL